MAKKKYYAVKRGRQEGIYETWQECREQVEGFSGAVFKGFATIEEARCFLRGNSQEAADGACDGQNEADGACDAQNKADGMDDSRNVKDGMSDSQDMGDGTGYVCAKKGDDAAGSMRHLVAYVDGSYNPETERYSYGCIMITPSGEEICKSGSNDNPETKALRNVAGEMLGAMTATKWAMDHGYKSMDLYYDYEGIERWATHEWSAGKELTKKYAAFMDNSAKVIQIRFRKVADHTGVKYNEKADQLAKKALS